MQVVDEHGVGLHRLAAHLGDRRRLDLLAVEVDVEQADPVGGLGGLGARRGAGDDQHLGRPLRHGRPHLPSTDYVAVVGADRAGGQAGGVEAGVGLGDPETHPVLPGNQPRDQPHLLVMGSELRQGHGAEDVQVQRAGAGKPRPALGHRLHGDGGLGEAQARAAEFDGHGRAQPAGLGHRGDERLGEVAGLIDVAPIAGVEAGAELQHPVADRLLLVGEPEAVHGVLSKRPGSKRPGSRRRA